VEVEGDWQFTWRRFGATPSQLRLLTEWLVEHEVEEVVMESTAQYWRPVWDALERDWQPTQRRRGDAVPTTGALHLAQAQSNQGPARPEARFPNAERLVKRLVAHELTLSFVPDVIAASLAHGDPAQVSADAKSRAAATASSLSSRKRTSTCPR